MTDLTLMKLSFVFNIFYKIINIENEEKKYFTVIPKNYTQKSGIEKYIVLKVTQVIFPSK